MAMSYIRSARANMVVPVESIMAITAVINPDNSYSFRYCSDVAGTTSIYIDLTSYPDPTSALQAGYNALVIELP